ncbi:uncharacterized protein VTP21DRAFT_9089 [Calcarisporiella thermophila]|uniref:uncharacterized protein n=1 Tax=Calcarisporiella thermophila TaxID=911321 RepID=UPI0037431B6E
MNRTLEDMLRHYTAYKQDNWDDLLPFVEFAYNDSMHISTRTTPFIADLGRTLRNPNMTRATIENPTAEELTEQLKKTLSTIIQMIKDAQERQREYADQQRSDVEFQENDQVMIRTTHLKPEVYCNAPSKKLSPRFAGPFKVLSRIGKVAYKLELPTNVRTHPVFHVSVLKKYEQATDDRNAPPPPPIIVDGETEYEVEKSSTSEDGTIAKST